MYLKWPKLCFGHESPTQNKLSWQLPLTTFTCSSWELSCATGLNLGQLAGTGPCPPPTQCLFRAVIFSRLCLLCVSWHPVLSFVFSMARLLIQNFPHCTSLDFNHHGKFPIITESWAMMSITIQIVVMIMGVVKFSTVGKYVMDQSHLHWVLCPPRPPVETCWWDSWSVPEPSVAESRRCLRTMPAHLSEKHSCVTSMLQDLEQNWDICYQYSQESFQLNSVNHIICSYYLLSW